MIKIIKPQNFKMRHTYTALIYGKPGTGKTTLALSAPKPLLLDFDGGMGRVDSMFWGDTLEIDNFQTVFDLLQESEKTLDDFDTIIIDTVGSFIESLCAHLVSKNPKLRGPAGGLTLKGYGELKNVVINLLNALKRKNKNIIFVAHEKEDTDDNGLKTVRPALGSGSGGELIKNAVDLMGYMHKENKKNVISFSPYDDTFLGKNSFNMPEKIEIPNPTESGRNDWFKTVVAKYVTQKIENAEKLRQDYDLAVNDINDVIDTITDEDSCNKVYNSLINDSKYKKINDWRPLLREKTEALNLKFDVTNRRFSYVHCNA